MKKKQQAFTIIETLMTLLAISVMIAGPLTFMYRSYKYADFSVTRAVSLGLAQEGLELTTSIRNGDLDNFLNMTTVCANGCAVDWDGESSMPTFTSCDAESDCKIYREGETGTEETDYFRRVKIVSNSTNPAISTTAYYIESSAWTYVDDVKVEVVLYKNMFSIEIKDKP